MIMAVLYTRVSSAEQLREGFSIPAQRASLQEYAERHSLQIVAEFSDDDTAKTTGRAGFAAMVAHLRANPLHAVIVEKTDRLYRNPKDYITLDDLGVEIHNVKEGGKERRDSDSRFMHWLRVGMARKYVENLSEEVKKGLTRKCEEGGWPTWAPLGYLNIKDGSGRAMIVPDPEKAPLVREIFEAAATGAYNLQSLANLAERIGLRGRHGTKVRKQTMSYVVRNEAYTGWFEWAGKRYHGNHEPLITADLYARAQRALQDGSRPKTRTHEFAYSGLFKCGLCGSALTGDLKKGKYTYYFCRCRRYYSEIVFDHAMVERFNAMQVDPEVSEWLIAYLARDFDASEVRDSVRAGWIRKRLSELQALAGASYEEKLLGKVTEETWREISAKWEREAGELRAELATIAPAMKRADFVRAVRTPFELAQTASAKFLTMKPREKGEVIRTCCSNLLVTEGNISIHMRSPYDVLMKIAGSPDWLGSLDVVRTAFVAFALKAA